MFKRLFTNKKASTYSVLVIDDDKPISRMIEDILQQEGYAVLVANGGEDALKLLDEGVNPNAIILDLMMPSMSGAQFLETARIRYGRSALAPTMILTATEGGDAIAQSLEADDMMRKPFDSERLLTQVWKLVQKQQKEKQ